MSKLMLRCGGLACLLALALLYQGQAAPILSDDSAADLSLVPPDSPGFITLRASAIWGDPSVKDLIKKLEGEGSGGQDFFKKAEKELGFDLKEVARVTIVLPPSIDDHDTPPFFIVTTTKELDKKKVQSAITPDGEEKKSASGKVYFQDKKRDNVLHFLGDKKLIVGGAKWTAAYLDQKLDSKEQARFKGIKDLMLTNTLAGTFDLAGYSKQMQKELSKEFKNIDALFGAKPALVTLEGGKDISLTGKLTYKDEDAAKDAAKAAKALQDQIVTQLGEQQKQIASLADNPEIKKNEKAVAQFKEMLALMKEIEESVKKTEIADKGKDVNVEFHSKVSVGKFVGSWFMMMTGSRAQRHLLKHPHLRSAS